MTPLRKLSISALATAVLAVTTGATGGRPPSWELSDTGVTARLRGLSALNDQVAWAAGSAGTVLRTVDGGQTWQRLDPPGAEQLQFRDIEAFDRDHAVALTIGEGDQSRVYATADGGRTWSETFRNDDPRAFYDCLTFLDRRHGLALSDPVDGRFRILATADGGNSWRVLPTAGMPPALPGEFAFAASGTCLVSVADGPGGIRPGGIRPGGIRPGGIRPGAHAGAGRAWFATGGAEQARVFSTADGGRTWAVVGTPVPSGPSAGIYSLAFRDARHGLAVGGDYAAPTSAPNAAAVSRDGGRRWTAAVTAPGEYRSGVAWASVRDATALAVGPTGSDITRDGGRTWARFDAGSFDAVDCAPRRACWASGEQGRVAVLRWRPRTDQAPARSGYAAA